METIAAITFLLLPGIFLGIKNNTEYGSYPSFGVAQRCLVMLLAFYVVTILLLGAEHVQGGNSLLSGYNLKKFGAFFIFPGIGVAIILFPKVAAEYLSQYPSLKFSNPLEMFSVWGWVILLISVLSALVWH